ncbi:hypothetical protein PIB30_010656 [Stylosanthes scabra]|uniref:Reverse transcriptase RNase H-like domain-containing protein n=1 Tax=Stylosanthes scabra TaxID=79078 RepID=A0ABU6V7U0_9FABA|nr:hypothetical protein [Stylosanthes scabra]
MSSDTNGLVKGLRDDTSFMKSITKRPPKRMEEIQDRSHDYLQQEEGQTVVKTDRDKKETSRRDPPREDHERIPAPRAIKNTHRGDRSAYYKYHKQNGHDTEDCRDLIDFIEQGLKKGKFREYTGRSNDRSDEKGTRQRVSSPDNKSTGGKDDHKEGTTRREIKMISGGLPDEGKPLIVYLASIVEAVAGALVQKKDKVQQPVYFISKTLQGAELKYQRLRKAGTRTDRDCSET